MKISKETLEQLETIYSITLFDNNVNEVEPNKATEIYIGWEKANGVLINPVLKTIKAKKSEITFEWVVSKLNADAIYKSFAEHFNKIVSKFGLYGYPTTYGIGVFVAVGFRNSINETKSQITNVLNQMGVKYENEYSEAGWVFRYKISKAKDNINKIEEILKDANNPGF